LPTKLQEIRSFTMMASYYRRFIDKFAYIAKPLTDYMRLKGKKTKVTLSKEAINAYNTLKERLTTPPVLKLADMTKPFEVRTDASEYAISGVLFQRDEEGHEQPVWYGSRVLSGTEQRYGAPEREMLAIQCFVQYWRPYLWGTKFKVYTDHSPLRNIKIDKNCSRRLAGMILKIQEYDFDLYYTPGEKNVADTLTRAPIVKASAKTDKGSNSKRSDYKMNTEVEAVVHSIVANINGVNTTPATTAQSHIKELYIACIAADGASAKATKNTVAKQCSKKQIERARRNVSIQEEQMKPFKISEIEMAEM
jgi:hypothetical protein